MKVDRRKWLRSLAKEILPPRLARAYRDHFGGGVRFSGNFQSWKAAMAASGGYGTQKIFERTRDAALKVKRGEAAYDRDAVVFDRVQFSFPVIAAMLKAALDRGGSLAVLDFGGSLGTSYRQLKTFVPSLPRLKWNIVEQQQFVDCGREIFQNEELAFHSSIKSAAQLPPDVVLLSGVLQYLEDPYELIEQCKSLAARYIVIDRTTIIDLSSDVLTVQHVPPTIVESSYPCWILSRDRVRRTLETSYQVVSEFEDSTDSWYCSAGRFRLAGYICEQKKEPD
jgi:putative methyltransferase (TIGR04325 family)